MLFITHDLSVLAAACQRLAVMYAGRIVEEGPAHEVFAAPAHPVHAGARGGVPDHRRPARSGTIRPGLAGDPPDPRDAAVRLPVPPALPGARDDRVRRAGRRRAAGRAGDRAAGARRASATRGARRHERRPAARAARPARRVPQPQRVARARRRRRRPRAAAGRGARARRRVRLRQDDARAHDPRARAAGVGRGPLPRRAAALRPPLAARRYRRDVQMVFQDPTGALNPRQTIYEAVAEGLRIHGRRGQRGGARRRRALARRAAAARALLHRATRTRSPAASASAS